jgi:import inner membrane translocase subunit TIM50
MACRQLKFRKLRHKIPQRLEKLVKVGVEEDERCRRALIPLPLSGNAALILPIYLGRNWESEEEEKRHPEAPSGWGFKLFYDRAQARMTKQIDYYTEPISPKLLPDVAKDNPDFYRPYTLVLSLEDLLIHSEWTREHGWRVSKRPGVDYFIRYLLPYYELVIFTSAPSSLADPIIRKLDPFHFVMWTMYREHTRYKNGEYVKASTSEPPFKHKLTHSRIFPA